MKTAEYSIPLASSLNSYACTVAGAYICQTKATDESPIAISTPPDENLLFGQMISRYKTNHKSVMQEYRNVRNKTVFLASEPRRLELQRECYRTSSLFSPSTHSITDEPVFAGLIPDFTTVYLHVQTVVADPAKQFHPSKDLVRLVRKCLAEPEQDVLSFLNDIIPLGPKFEINENNIYEMITKQVEGVLTKTAKKEARFVTSVQITNAGRFTEPVSADLGHGLGLTVYDAPKVLDRIYRELFDFLDLSHRVRSWGTILIANSEIEIRIKEGSFKIPDFYDIVNDDKWEIS